MADKVNRLKENFENGRFGDVLLGALNTGNGLMQDRIFAGNKDVKGNDFGKYVGKKKRLSDKAQLTALFNTK
jgi:hypothetical protein